ncbi:MAG: hypothetical protein J3Q66DRAFT_383087 [Benniella sp.]|nr:MAG: hypothetical protein J3Q66DRAFT_383087 [Benniella sp.]
MLKIILLSFVLCFLSVLSLVDAQVTGSCGSTSGGQSCSPGLCCSSSPLFGAPCMGITTPPPEPTSAILDITTLPIPITTPPISTITVTVTTSGISSRPTSPTGAAPSLDKKIGSRLALVVVVLVCLFV